MEVSASDIAATKKKLDDVLARHKEQGWPSGWWPPMFIDVLNIHKMVNQRMKYRSDYMKHGIRDKWETPFEVFEEYELGDESTYGTGDCEEFALCKALMLAELGQSAAFALVINRARSTIRHIDWHALAVVGEKDLILDLPDLSPRDGTLWPKKRYEMLGVYKFFEELIWPIE